MHVWQSKLCNSSDKIGRRYFMKIAILGPSPVPFTIGGVENLLWSLCETINQKTEHNAELIKVPIKEDSFWNLLESYYAFYKLDLKHFDAVICTKYPSWMIEHSNCIYYMPHCLRGLYDTYHFMNLPLEVKRGNSKIDYVLEYMEDNLMPFSLDSFFDMLFSLRDDKAIPEEYFAFPGPFIRRIIHYLDNYGMSKNMPKVFYAISQTVKNRTDYFPENAQVEVVYPAPALKDYGCGEYDYVFMISRLDAPKRIDILIKAMKYVKSGVKLLIAGTGPQETELRALAKGNDNIKFLGFVNDDEAEELYANCLVVPYFPYDEDYGYITVETMLHKKPVITTVDAGGPTEFVENNKTGFICKTDAKDIAKKIDFFAENKQEAKRMGENAYNLVKQITWEAGVEKLLNVENMKKLDTKSCLDRKKIVVTSSFSVYPPLNGGQARIFNLYKEVAKKHDVEIISLAAGDMQMQSKIIAPGLTEIVIPKSIRHQEQEWEKIEKKLGVPASDIATIVLSGETSEYGRVLSKATQGADLIVVSHPYLYREVEKLNIDCPIVYESHNVEYEMKKAVLPSSKFAKECLKMVYEVEKKCGQDSAFIMTCSEDDIVKLCDIYGLNKELMVEVPNGVNCRETIFTNSLSRNDNKKSLGLDNEFLALFMGSWHGPNLEACEFIFELADQCPNVTFLLMGSQCNYFAKRKIPSNVGMLGIVSESEKNRIFSVVDVALNPMVSGSGTNLKMFDYMSAGIPVITTEFGTRGISDKEIFYIADSIENMKECLEDFDISIAMKKAERARKYVETHYDWSVIAEKLCAKIDEV